MPPTNPEDEFQPAGEIIGTAAELVGGDRDRTHGDKRANFQTTVDLWNGYAKARGWDIAFQPEDFGRMMVLAKMSRAIVGEFNVDDYIDMAGYAGCAGEVHGQSDALAKEWAAERAKERESVVSAKEVVSLMEEVGAVQTAIEERTAKISVGPVRMNPPLHPGAAWRWPFS